MKLYKVADDSIFAYVDAKGFYSFASTDDVVELVDDCARVHTEGRTILTQNGKNKVLIAVKNGILKEIEK